MGGRFPCLTSIVGQIIYYFIFGVLGACRQAPYKFKKSYVGAALYWELLIVSTLGTVKPTISPYIGGSGTWKCFSLHHQGIGGTKDPHSAMLGGHSTLNTVVFITIRDEGIY